MNTELLVLGGFWFWALLAAATALLLVALECRQAFWAVVAVVVPLLLLQFLGGIPVLLWPWRHPGASLLAGIGYFLAGALWSIAKWWFHVAAQRRRYDEIRQTFCRERELKHGSPIPADSQSDFRNALYGVEVPPRARDHKGEIFLWIGYWPWSVLWTLLNDPIRRLIEHIYHQIVGLLDWISTRAFRGTEQDTGNPPGY